MINQPMLVEACTIQDAWIEALKLLRDSNWVLYNLVVTVKDASAFDVCKHKKINDFFNAQGINIPKHVAYTIFPQNLYLRTKSADKLFEEYNKSNGFYEKVRYLSSSGWGTYFRRMTNYEETANPVNQLDNIITSILASVKTFTARYTVVIQHPGRETIRARGGPCLNYIAIQISKEPVPTLGLLCVYRNHYFLDKAYGNYWGLTNLLSFLAEATGLAKGPLTCISSHALVSKSKPEITAFLDNYY